ncbi:DNA helicase B [Bombina bombina]|uniref:DNA helicase B n=1 Tax=Bombina bombina TaxID=8345 RepID=UPI00235A9C79|nr:DNA helicase B [Bombina bombina]
MSMRGRKTHWEVLEGRLLPVKDVALTEDNDEPEEEDEKGEEVDFLDAEEILSDGVTAKSESLRSSKVIIKDELSREHHVTGFFPFVDPWWSVRVEVKRIGSQCFARGYPSYALIRGDLSGEKTGILSIFLTKCCLPDERKQDFIDWLPNTPVTFENLQTLAEEYTEEDPHHFNLLPYIQHSGGLAIEDVDLEVEIGIEVEGAIIKTTPTLLRTMLDVNKLIRNLTLRKHFQGDTTMAQDHLDVHIQQGSENLRFVDFSEACDVISLQHLGRQGEVSDPSNNISSFSGFKKLSVFYPIQSRGTILETFFKRVENDLTLLASRTETSGEFKTKSNLTVTERKAISDLQKNNNIVIRTADKGGAVVVLDREVYIYEAHRQLHDTDNYLELDRDPTLSFQRDLRRLLDDGLEDGHFDSATFEYLYVECPVVPIFHHLPKVHKTLTEVKGRPIISGIGSIFEHLSQWRYIDDLLFVWCGSPTDLIDFVNRLNDNDAGLKFTFEKHHTEINFLDLTLKADRSGPGPLVMKALEFPLVYEFLPKLLPRRVRSLLQTRGMEEKDSQECTKSNPLDRIPLIENMLRSDPWKIGFGKFVYKEVGLLCCEANWTNFLQCECLLEKIPNLQKNALIIYNTLKKRCLELGDTYAEQDALCSAVSYDMPYNEGWDALKFLRDNEIVMFEGQRVALASLYRYENNIAKYIHKLVTRRAWTLDIDVREALEGTLSSAETEVNEKTDVSNHSQLETVPDEKTSADQIKMLHISSSPTPTKDSKSAIFDPDQLKAAKMICSNPVTVISGKGGCGKTTVVSLVFKHLMKKENEDIAEACKALEDDLDASQEWNCDSMQSTATSETHARVLLTAPTGKAASILKKKTGLPAATLHQITCSYSRYRQQQNSTAAWKFSKVEVLVVDEGSLVSVHIFSSTLQLLCDHGRLAKLIILGDVRQLPSIEPGNLLADIFKRLDSMQWAIELRTNHRAESQLIVDNAAEISQQNFPQFDAVINISSDSDIEMPGDDKKFILVSLPDESEHVIQNKNVFGVPCPTDEVLSRLELPEVKLPEEPKIPKLDRVYEDGKVPQTFPVPVRMANIISNVWKECSLINDLCCKHFSGHLTKNHKNKLDFQCKDKICCSRNAYLKDVLFDSEKDKCDDDERLCNGEIFFITNDVEYERKQRALTINDVEGREYTLDYRKLRIECDLKHAWARTIHTFQGSEEDTVVYVLGNAGRQNWKHVYTAITRGRKRVYIVASKNQLHQAIANQARNRKTRLQQCIKEMLSLNITCPTASPPAQTHESQLPCEKMKDPDIKHALNGELQPHPPMPCTSVPGRIVEPLSLNNISVLNDSVVHVLTPTAGVSGEHRYFDFNAMQQSPNCKRQGLSLGDNCSPSPSKISRTAASKNVNISPSGIGMQNLRIKGRPPKKLF